MTELDRYALARYLAPDVKFVQPWPETLAEEVGRRVVFMGVADAIRRGHRPGWLADDQEWKNQLQALDRDEVDWFHQQWEFAGGRRPTVDTSWITREKGGRRRQRLIRPGDVWPTILVVSLALLPFVAVALYAAGVSR